MEVTADEDRTVPRAAVTVKGSGLGFRLVCGQ